MRLLRSLSLFAAVVTAAALSASSLTAQAPKSGWRAEVLSRFSSAEKKFTQIADATPWEKYSWRPGKGVRSICEVFLHIAGDNYLLAEPPGAKKPASIDYKTIEACPADKAKVLATMKAGFDHLHAAINATPDTDAEGMIDLFGSKMTKRALLLAIAEHAGEHLGQSIAYARVNGMVPPWSAKGGM